MPLSNRFTLQYKACTAGIAYMRSRTREEIADDVSSACMQLRGGVCEGHAGTANMYGLLFRRSSSQCLRSLPQLLHFRPTSSKCWGQKAARKEP